MFIHCIFIVATPTRNTNHHHSHHHNLMTVLKPLKLLILTLRVMRVIIFYFLTKIAVGAARPTAQGQAITRMAKANMKENNAGPADRRGRR